MTTNYQPSFRNRLRWTVALFLSFLLTTAYAQTIHPPVNLKCEYLTTPLGIDTPRPRLSWEVGDRSRRAVQSAYQILVASSPEKLADGVGDLWDSGKVASAKTLHIAYEGKDLESGTRYYWQVRSWNGVDEPSSYSAVSWFETGLLSADDWQAQWIGDGREPPEKPEDFYEKIPAPLFRKEFQIAKPVRPARLYITGLGYHEPWLNGERVGDHWLDPGWTQYAKTVYYVVHDVTDQLSQGENTLGVMLGNGWYNPLPMKLFGRWNLREILTIGRPKLISRLQIEYEDGSNECIVSDESWKAGTGPIVRDNVYLGEWYDARLEQEGWTSPGFDYSNWNNAVAETPPGGELRWQFVPPIRHTRTVEPVRIDSPEPGKYVVDMGQNFAGVIRFQGRAPAGTEVVFRYAELIEEDGRIDVNTTVATQLKRPGMGGPGAPDVAWQEDRYIFKGEGVETFEPRFTFHGFRYVEITGLPYRPSLNDIVGLRLNSDLEQASRFECSNELFNRVQNITEWTMLSNVFSIESDCPAREKFGYGGDIVTVGEAYMTNYDMSGFYVKSVRDFERDARASGGMTECAPDIGINQRGLTEDTGPVGWTLAHPFVLYQLYKYYGNLDIVQEQYGPLKKLVEFYRERSPDYLIMDGIGDHNSVDQRPRPVTSTAFYYHHAKILSDLAGILDKKNDQATYAALADSIRAAFIDKFVHPETGQVFTHTQASQVTALYYDLLPEDLREKAFQVLLDEIYLKYKGHLSTGIFTTKMMLNYLSDRSRDDVAYDMMNQKSFPGFGYMVDRGATTLWENWSFEEHDSKNHPMFGSVSEWYYKSILGIRQAPESVAFSDNIIKPAVVGDLTWAKGYYRSVRGKIASRWWKYGDDLILEVEIPANTRAQIHVPIIGKARPDIFEGPHQLVKQGKPAENDTQIELLSTGRDYYVFGLGSGRYRFEVR